MAALADGAARTVKKTIKLMPEAVRKALPYDLLLAVAPGYLPLTIREAMVANGDTSLPPQYQQKKPILDQCRLMEPLEPFPYNEFKFGISVFLKKVLLSTGPFNLRNQSLGNALQQVIEEHYQQQITALNRGQLPLLVPAVDKKSTIYAGRTLMRRAEGRCTGMKFLRKGESLRDFFREEAVHRFAHGEHNLTTLLKSEVPKPVGIKLVPIENCLISLFQAFVVSLKGSRLVTRRTILSMNSPPEMRITVHWHTRKTAMVIARGQNRDFSKPVTIWGYGAVLGPFIPPPFVRTTIL